MRGSKKVLSEGGPTLTVFFLIDEGREDPNTIYHYKLEIIGPPAKWRFTGVPNDGPTLNAQISTSHKTKNTEN